MNDINSSGMTLTRVKESIELEFGPFYGQGGVVRQEGTTELYLNPGVPRHFQLVPYTCAPHREAYTIHRC